MSKSEKQQSHLHLACLHLIGKTPKADIGISLRSFLLGSCEGTFCSILVAERLRGWLPGLRPALLSVVVVGSNS